MQKIILGLTGGIACYKTAELASILTKENFDVYTVMTKEACEFITPLTIKTLTSKPVYTDQFQYDEFSPVHTELARESKLLVIAPATANIIAKIAHGICDDLLTTVACAFTGKIIIAPAMNTSMWENPITQNNIRILKEKLDVEIVEPTFGELACKTIGIGRLADPKSIAERVVDLFNQTHISDIPIPSHSLTPDEAVKILDKYSDDTLKKVKVLITAGGTKEAIDPVRFISNKSSGKTGIAIADEAYKRGAKVILISTRKIDRPYQVIEVETAYQMQQAVEKYFDSCQILIMAAAVSDYTPLKVSESKIKKTADSDLVLTLTKNPDIVGTLAPLKKENQVLIGFAAESENLIQNAKKKFKNKKLDLIVANQINIPDIGFSSDYNEVHFITADEDVFVPKTLKSDIARKMWDFVEEKFKNTIKKK